MSTAAVNLYYREYGEKGKPVLMLLHGLFGSSNNWLGIVKYLQDDYHLILPDLRNHGRSPHSETMDYPALASDLLNLMAQLQLESVSLLGHSMGGKTAMWLALNLPERVDQLVVADMAPVSYHNRFEKIFQGLFELPLDELQGREAADQYLSRRVPERLVRQYLLQNLVKGVDGWQWRCNLPVLNREVMVLAGFPALNDLAFPGEVLFVYGERSDYVLPEYRSVIDRHFPHARLRMLNGTGHWLYAEQPEVFSRTVKAFMK
ncbi:MAG: alpha/beta fold hydrolase [Candidatus Thiodiazotropha sp. (ex Semelilucina semeliformis)]|nr:alpha/beta fold hydrolase [Candidatus Thiodiazotropha sp. (ex Semelilucina semeliformis)]